MLALKIRHVTTYRYASPVIFGEHRLMLRPRDSHDLRLVRAGLAVTPAATLRWAHDVFGNSIAFARFADPAAELRIESELDLVRYPPDLIELALDPAANFYPFIYSADDRADLGRLLERHYPDPRDRVGRWARELAWEAGPGTMDILRRVNAVFRQRFAYGARDAEGTQTPNETLDLGGGTCRDYALLMIEALRSLGFGARFVTGYLYDPATDGGLGGVTGAGATHAWVEVYLPGIGWLEFDPTNDTVGADALVRVAATRDPNHAVPISGVFSGGSPLGMTVDVTVVSTAVQA